MVLMHKLEITKISKNSIRESDQDSVESKEATSGMFFIESIPTVGKKVVTTTFLLRDNTIQDVLVSTGTG